LKRFYVQQLINARDSRSYGYFRAAVIQVEALLRHLFKNFLRQSTVIKNGRYKNVLDHRQKQVSSIWLKNTLANSYQEILVSCPQLIEWENKIYKFRKKVIHYGQTLSVDESKDPIEGVCKTIIFIK